VPTTHILKPAISGLDDHDLNEHLCLAAARHLGLDAAVSRVASFDGERVIVIDRYDRSRGADGTVGRLHQEDLCQALAIPPVIKYQSEGGPSPEQIISLLRTEGAGDGADVKLRMAMRIGGEGRIAAVGARHWRRLAERNGLDPDATVARVAELAARTPDAFEAVATGDPLAELLSERVAAHAERCGAALAEG
jgi:serine/threonine-protein kinase HipA